MSDKEKDTTKESNNDDGSHEDSSSELAIPSEDGGAAGDDDALGDDDDDVDEEEDDDVEDDDDDDELPMDSTVPDNAYISGQTTVLVNMWSGDQFDISLKSTTPLEKLMDYVCNRYDIVRTETRFSFQGRSIKPGDTLQSLNIPNDSVIDVFTQQVGGNVGW